MDKEIPVIKLIAKYILLVIGIDAIVGIIEGLFDFNDYDVFSFLLDLISSILVILIIKEADKLIYKENIFDKFHNQLGTIKNVILTILIVSISLGLTNITEPISNLIPVPEFFKEYWKEVLTKPESNIKMVFAIISVVILAPLVEEILFRGFIYKTLRTKYNISFSIFISFILFYLLHLDPQMLIMLSVVSISLCLSYEYSKSLTLPFLIHSGINFSSLLLNWYGTS